MLGFVIKITHGFNYGAWVVFSRQLGKCCDAIARSSIPKSGTEQGQDKNLRCILELIQLIYE
ncbi:MAG: hypothetical protein EA367_08780, partial [Leptolyngbya sp. DLM2.Bin15]